MLHVYTGNGKGKTTAAVGLSIRAAGNDYKVIFSQFMKGGATGELEILNRDDRITVIRSEKRFPFYKNMSDSEKAEQTQIHNDILDQILLIVRKSIEDANANSDSSKNSCKKLLVVLDEATYPVSYGLVDEGKLKELVDYSSDDIEIVITGRNAAEWMIEKADYITEMKCIKHTFQKGMVARKGIEY